MFVSKFHLFLGLVVCATSRNPPTKQQHKKLNKNSSRRVVLHEFVYKYNYYLSDYFDWQDIKYWSLIDRRDKRFLCIFNRACVFVLHLISFDERKFIHDTWTIIINKSKCSLWYLTDVIFNHKNCFCSFSLNKLFISVGGVPQLTFPRRTIWRPFYHKNVCFKNIT